MARRQSSFSRTRIEKEEMSRYKLFPLHCCLDFLWSFKEKLSLRGLGSAWLYCYRVLLGEEGQMVTSLGKVRAPRWDDLISQNFVV